MIGSSHAQLYEKNSCSVKLFCKVVLNDKQMPHEILFSLLDDITKHNKDEHMRIERKEIWNKSKRNKATCFNI